VRSTSAKEFDHGHHAFVFVVGGVGLIDKTSDDHRAREGIPAFRFSAVHTKM
jgi:hypothetical protein